MSRNDNNDTPPPPPFQPFFIRDSGAPADCIGVILNHLEIVDLLALCRVSKYLHACVKVNSKHASMAVRWALKMLSISMEDVNRIPTPKSVMERIKTRGIFPIRIILNNFGLHELQYAYTVQQDHPDDSDCRIIPWALPLKTENNLEEELVFAPKLATLPILKQYVANYLNANIFSVITKENANDSDRLPEEEEYEIRRVDFDYVNRCCPCFRMMKRRGDGDKYRLVVTVASYRMPLPYRSLREHVLLTDYLFTIDDIIITQRASEMITNPAWLATQPLKFNKTMQTWWASQKGKEWKQRAHWSLYPEIDWYFK